MAASWDLSEELLCCDESMDLRPEPRGAERQSPRVGAAILFFGSSWRSHPRQSVVGACLLVSDRFLSAMSSLEIMNRASNPLSC